MQRAFYESRRRFNVVPAGRRSGKTEIAKRRLVKRAVKGSRYDRPRYFYGAPTRDQVKRIAWDDLKRMVPRDAMRGGPTPSESELTIPLWHGGELFLVGMDKPERIEGAPCRRRRARRVRQHEAAGVGRERAPRALRSAGLVRPDRRAGGPESLLRHRAARAGASWPSTATRASGALPLDREADILPAEEIEAAKRDLDELTFQQEYEASFVNFEGRAYYAFTDANKARSALYDPRSRSSSASTSTSRPASPRSRRSCRCPARQAARRHGA
jgi:hypothetical protein